VGEHLPERWVERREESEPSRGCLLLEEELKETKARKRTNSNKQDITRKPRASIPATPIYNLLGIQIIGIQRVGLPLKIFDQTPPPPPPPPPPPHTLHTSMQTQVVPIHTFITITTFCFWRDFYGASRHARTSPTSACLGRRCLYLPRRLVALRNCLVVARDRRHGLRTLNPKP
jgi:hypothetical protein